MTIRVYLDHLRNRYDGYNQCFDDLYNGKYGKPYPMTVYTEFELPDIKQEAKAQGIYEPDSGPNAQEFLD